MSGGTLDYFYLYLFEEWYEKIKADSPVFSKMVYDLGYMLKGYDYWISGDTSEEDFLSAWERFCKKWSIKEPDNLEESISD